MQRFGEMFGQTQKPSLKGFTKREPQDSPLENVNSDEDSL